jgi:hypothetical protein
MDGTSRVRAARVGAACALLAVCVAETGCLSAGPPDYKDPTQTRPFLLTEEAEPPVGIQTGITSGEQIEITVPVKSEDRGDPLQGVLYTNFDVEGSNPIDVSAQPIAPSTFDDPNVRAYSYTWTVPGVAPSPKCIKLTLVVSHKSNFVGDHPSNFADVALATWWFDVDDDGTNAIKSCPQTGQPAQSGGPDQ